MKIKKVLYGILFLFLFLISGTVFAQDKQVTGTVTDSTGAPVANASVLVKNTKIGTQTAANGTFSLTVPASATTLTISSVGYDAQDVPIGNGPITVSLQANSTSLAAVTVVSVGYGTLNKREVSSAITHLSANDLTKVASNSPLMSIQGKVAGLTVTNTSAADPNSTPTIQLRGVSSRNAGLGPLYVINGIPGGNIDNINQNDIESIDVLKGGAASAIYGTRGSNGVIVITTKKGTSEPRTFYDGYASFDYATNKLQVLSKEDFLKNNRGIDYGGNTDWMKAVARNPAFTQKHTLQVSGGSSRTNLFCFGGLPQCTRHRPESIQRRVWRTC